MCGSGENNDMIDHAIAIRALLRDLTECGDTGMVLKCENRYFIALVDVLGHGAEARKIAAMAEECLRNSQGDDVREVMMSLHQALSGSRGAVASICSLDADTGKLTYTGIGNITTRIMGIKSARLVPKDGIVGFGSIRPQVREIFLMSGDTVILHSDGIREHFDMLDWPELYMDSAEKIAWGILQRYGDKGDDASCIALKYQN